MKQGHNYLRQLTLLAALLVLAVMIQGCSQASGNLNGSWVPVRQEIAGKELPAIAFAKQQLILNDSMYTFTAESVDKGVVRYNGNKMDIYGREGVNTGKHFTAMFKYENDQLSICYNLAGNGYPETFETKGKPGFFLCVFKKESMK